MKETLTRIKDILEDFFSYLHLYDIALLAAFMLLGMCFIFLSFIAFRRKILSIPLFIIGFSIMIALPFAMRYFMEERFYKIEISKSYDSVYNYSDVYQYIAKVTNIGKRNIAGCIISHQVLYDTSNDQSMIDKYKHMLLNYVKPKKIYNLDINLDLKVGQTIELTDLIEDYPHRGEPYVTKVECYGKKRYKDGDKVLQGIYEKAPEKDTDTNTESKTQDSTESTENTESTQTIDSPSATTTQTTQEETSAAVNNTSNESTNAITQDSTTNTTNTESTENIESSNTQNQNNTVQNNQDINNNQNTDKQDTTQTQTNSNTNNTNNIDNNNEEENSLDPDWREKRDNFRVPLLKENPR